MIQKLRLQNFKCFEDLSLELGSLTLLAGLNGMGKSTVLQSLLLLRQSYLQGLLEETGLALNGNLVSIGTASDALFEGAIEEEIGFELALTNGEEGRWLFNYDREADVLDLDGDKTEVSFEVFSSSLFNNNFHYLQAERIGPRTSYEMSDFLVRQQRQLGNCGEYTAHFLTIYGSDKIPNDALAHSQSASDQINHQVEAWLGVVCPGTRLDVMSHADMDLVNLQYSFVRGKQTSNYYRSTNVGFGITYTLPILVAILASPPGSLLLLENPEAHLHPKGQSSLGDLMAIAASCGVQVIVETHSDHVLNGIRIAVHKKKISPDKVRLYFFEPPKKDGQTHNEVISLNIDSDGRIDRWPDDFFDEWDKSLEALLDFGGM